jgi:hypothetical protein
MRFVYVDVEFAVAGVKKFDASLTQGGPGAALGGVMEDLTRMFAFV